MLQDSPQALQSVPPALHLGVSVVPHLAQLLWGFFGLKESGLLASVGAVAASFPTDGARSGAG